MFTSKKSLSLLIQSFIRFFIITAIVIQTFGYYLSFINGLYEDSQPPFYLNLIYTLRDLCLFTNIVLLTVLRKFRIDSLIVIFVSIFVVVYTSAFFQENMKFFKDVSTNFIMAIQIYVIVRAKLVDIFRIKSVIVWLCRFLACYSVFLFFNEQTTLLFHDKYMDFANAIGIVCGFLFYSGIVEGKKLDLVLAIVEYLVLLIAGGRGALLSLSLLIICLVYLKFKHNKKILFLVCVISLAIPSLFYLFTDAIGSFLGFESRNISRIIEGDFFRGADRYELYSHLLDRAEQDWFLGHGICADRYYLTTDGLADNGFYAHNIFVELFIDFGFIGLFFFAYLVFIILRFFMKCKNVNLKGIVLVYVFVSLVQLFLSRSFLNESNLFMMFAIIVNYLKTPVKCTINR